MSSFNPWQVESLEAFNYLCCPECVYRSKEPSTFEAHALQNHPLAITLFTTWDEEEEEAKVKQEPGVKCDEEELDHKVLDYLVVDQTKVESNLDADLEDHIFNENESDEESDGENDDEPIHLCKICNHEFTTRKDSMIFDDAAFSVHFLMKNSKSGF